MKKIIFSLKLENKVFQSQNDYLKVSPAFAESEINELIKENLSQLAFAPYLKTLNYVIKDDEFYVEGTAF